MSNFTVIVIAASAATFIATGGYSLTPRAWYDPACDIKGNASINTGERWFCSEQEAREAGWRKAGR